MSKRSENKVTAQKNGRSSAKISRRDGLFKEFFLAWYVVDRKGVIQNCNGVFATLLGWKGKREALGRLIAERSMEWADFFTNGDVAVFKDGKVRDQSKVFTLVRAQPLIRLVKFPSQERGSQITQVTGVILNVGLACGNQRRLAYHLERMAIKTEKLQKELTTIRDESKELKDVRSYLNGILDNIPGFVYWKNRSGIILGDNKQHAQILGFEDTKDVIGKTDYDFAWREQADEMRRNDLMVMRSGKVITTEEEGVLADGTKIIGLTRKAPLRNDLNKIVGVIGISIDVTERKLAERRSEILKLENELQKTKLQEQERFRAMTSQVVHDIRSPLASLSMIVESCQNLPESERTLLRNVVTNINDIANNLLSGYKRHDREVAAKKRQSQYILVVLALLEILSSKKYQYKQLPVTLTLTTIPINHFLFIKANLPDFNRMISNLINNAVEALDGNEGIVNLEVTADAEHVKIWIQDNGKGMPQEVLAKIMNSIPITSGKLDGNGIGLIQVRNALKNSNASMAIETEEQQGTKIILTFPRVAAPDWIAEAIQVTEGDTILILDDDLSIHQAWESRFESHANLIKLKHFEEGEDLIKFFKNLSKQERDRVFLLSDFELIGQELNGFQVIKKLRLQRQAILVTSHHNNPQVREWVVMARIKLLPKQLASNVPIEVRPRVGGSKRLGVSAECRDNEQTEGAFCLHRPGESANNRTEELETERKANPLPTPPFSNVEVIIVDDVRLFADSLANFLRARNLKVVTYYRPADLLQELASYSRDTKIILDKNMDDQIDGIELAENLHQRGYRKLFLLSGEELAANLVPKYLTVVLKNDLRELDRLISGDTEEHD